MFGGNFILKKPLGGLNSLKSHKPIELDELVGKYTVLKPGTYFIQHYLFILNLESHIKH
jgi:hypothetical protein